MAIGKATSVRHCNFYKSLESKRSKKRKSPASFTQETGDQNYGAVITGFRIADSSLRIRIPDSQLRTGIGYFTSSILRTILSLPLWSA